MIYLQDIFKHDDALTWTLLFLEIQKFYLKHVCFPAFQRSDVCEQKQKVDKLVAHFGQLVRTFP